MNNEVVKSISEPEVFDAEVISSDRPVLVDFWAPWCGPCKQVAPIVEAVAGELSGRIGAVKANVDEMRDIAVRFNVRAIPTLMIFKGGEVVAQKAGALSKEQLTEFIEENI